MSCPTTPWQACQGAFLRLGTGDVEVVNDPSQPLGSIDGNSGYCRFCGHCPTLAQRSQKGGQGTFPISRPVAPMIWKRSLTA